ncbi:MAG: energy-dependent translational throttle protein EttA [Sulfurimicrobium sp.]|nr:energy-dependent translational throttle protein EttA [Sulfurimicrobium sp.]
MLSIQNLVYFQQGTPLFQQANLPVFAEQRIGLVGKNGCGKSTLFRLIRGEIKPDSGEVALQQGKTLAFVEQEIANSERPALEFVLDGDAELRRLEHILARDTHDTEWFEAQHRYEAIEGYAAPSRGATLLDGLGFSPDRIMLPVASFSGGWRMRLNLARALMRRADLLLLDEPTNHLDAESVEWLEHFLTRFPGTVVAVTHDRYFLDNAAEWILELDRGHGIPWKGNYSSWLEQKEARLEQENKQIDAHMKAMKQELEWVRQNPKARQAKSKARLARFDELNSQEYQKRNETQEIFIPVADRLGANVIEFDGVSKAYGDRLLMDNLSFQVPPGAIVGIIGPNGAGKSTLFRMITGKEQPDSGAVKIGPTVKLAYVDQSRDALDAKKTVFEEISGGAEILTVGKYETPSRAYIGRFNFKGGDQQKIVGNLSGGERGRLHLAKTLIAGGNVLLLDEPSNDLDVETLRALEDALLEFAGCVLVISHDRWFLDRIATHILAAEGDSQWNFFNGNYQEYEADKKKRLGEEGAKPKRIRYKPISR